MASNMKECLAVLDNEGNVTEVLNTRTGKLEKAPSQQQKMVFNSKTGKLGLTSGLTSQNVDNMLALGMAADGFF